MSHSDKAKWAEDMMEEDDPMIEDNTEEDDDDFETAERMAMERFGFDSPRGRMPMMRSGRHQSGGSGGDPYRYGYTDVLDEKGEPLAAVTPPEKVVHQKFFNDFPDDFDDEDLA